jgi:predicted RND superfamily exporter protein
VQEAVRRSHKSIGSAIYFTSLTIIAGFTILAFSNFMPTVYFGLFTSLAMLLALMANLMILPSLLVKFYR